LAALKNFMVLLMAVATLFISGCRADAEHDRVQENSQQVYQTEKTAKIDGVSLSIVEKNSECFVQYEGELGSGTLPLAVPPPCHFILDYKNDVRYESYGTADIKTVVIVLGGKIQPDALTPISSRNDCGNRWQGIVISKTRIYLSDRIGKGIACAGVGLDEKEFQMFLKDNRPQ